MQVGLCLNYIYLPLFHSLNVSSSFGLFGAIIRSSYSASCQLCVYNYNTYLFYGSGDIRTRVRIQWKWGFPKIVWHLWLSSSRAVWLSEQCRMLLIKLHVQMFNVQCFFLFTIMISIFGERDQFTLCHTRYMCDIHILYDYRWIKVFCKFNKLLHCQWIWMKSAYFMAFAFVPRWWNETNAMIVCFFFFFFCSLAGVAKMFVHIFLMGKMFVWFICAEPLYGRILFNLFWCWQR